MNYINQDLIKYLFSYREDGYLIWNNGKKFKQIAGYINKKTHYNKDFSYNEYSRRRVKIQGKLYYHYRLIWLYHYDFPIPEYIDHIDGNSLNDKLENLRASSNSENIINQKRLSIRNKSGLVGVFETESGTWEAGIGLNNKRIYLGTFSSKEEAGEAYDKAALDLYKEFAVINTQRV